MEHPQTQTRHIGRNGRYATPRAYPELVKTPAMSEREATYHAALKLVADFLRKNVREADFLFRWGGDEFLMLLTCTEAEAARKGIELRHTFAESIEGRPYPHGFGLSVGAAELPADRADFLSVIKDADARMYRDKTRTRAKPRRRRA